MILLMATKDTIIHCSIKTPLEPDQFVQMIERISEKAERRNADHRSTSNRVNIEPQNIRVFLNENTGSIKGVWICGEQHPHLQVLV